MKLITLLLLSGSSVLSAAAVSGTDLVPWCNAVQNNVGFIRYPLGTVGVWSAPAGETADVITRVPRIYPCVEKPVVKGLKDDWRAAIGGDPSLLNISYQSTKPCGESKGALTVSPHVAVFKLVFPANATNKFVLIDFSPGTVDNWAKLSHWTNRTMKCIDPRTFEASIKGPGHPGAWYRITFSAPCRAFGTVEDSGAIGEAADHFSGPAPRMFARFEVPAVTISVAESFVSPTEADAFLRAESADFETVHQRCHKAWNDVLNRVDIDGDANARRMVYTALYTLYVNIIDGGDGSCYRSFYPHPRSIASSAYWQFIGGYQSCCWDNIRATYPFLTLAYPEVMSDILGTYLARFQREGCLDGDICLFTGTMGHKNIRFVPVLVAQAQATGVSADYPKLYSALKENFTNDAYFPPTLLTQGHMVQNETGGFACSRTLEFATGLNAMAMLAKANHDSEGTTRYASLSKCYTNLWDGNNRAFRLKQADETWGPIENSKMTWNPNPQGLFEGTTRDWRFAIPHDPFGLIDLVGQDRFVAEVTNYCMTDCWFNDYQTCYPYLLYYAGAPDEAQQIIRTSWVPMFERGVIYEGVRPKPPHNGWQTHYTGNAGWLLCSMLGLYPTFAPPGQFIISSPSLNHAVIRTGKHELQIEATQNSSENIYVQSIRLNGRAYPCYLIPANRLAAGARLELDMTSNPSAGLGPIYVISSDGFVREAELRSPSRLRCVVEAVALDATTKIHSATKPAKVLVNGLEQSNFSYDSGRQELTVTTTGSAVIEAVCN